MSASTAAASPGRRRPAYTPRERCDYEARSNFTAIPNEYVDELVGYLPAAQMVILVVLLRQTVGWHEQWAELSEEWVERLAVDRATFSRHLKDLRALQLVSDRKSTRGDGRLREYRVHPENFKAVGARAKKRAKLHRVREKPVEKAEVSEKSLIKVSTIAALRKPAAAPESRVSCPHGLPCPHPESALEKVVSIDGASPPGEGPPGEKSLIRVSTTSPEPADSKASRLAQLRAGLAPLLLRHDQAPDKALLDGILTRLGECPIERYLTKLAEALGKTGVRNARGLAMRVAEQSAEEWKARKASIVEADKRAELDERARKLLPGRDYAAIERAYHDYRDRGDKASVKWLLDNFPELKE